MNSCELEMQRVLGQLLPILRKIGATLNNDVTDELEARIMHSMLCEIGNGPRTFDDWMISIAKWNYLIDGINAPRYALHFSAYVMPTTPPAETPILDTSNIPF